MMLLCVCKCMLLCECMCIAGEARMRAACVSSVLCTRVLVCQAQGSECEACEDEAKPGARHASFSACTKSYGVDRHRKICKGSRASQASELALDEWRAGRATLFLDALLLLLCGSS